MPSPAVSHNGALTTPKINKRIMDEHLFLKSQRVKTPDGGGEVVAAIGDDMVVKLDSGDTQTFPSDQLEDDNSAG